MSLIRHVALWVIVTLVSLLAMFTSGTVAAPLSVIGPDTPIPARYFYAVTTDGRLLIYIDASSDTASNWLAQAVEAPPLRA